MPPLVRTERHTIIFINITDGGAKEMPHHFTSVWPLSSCRRIPGSGDTLERVLTMTKKGKKALLPFLAVGIAVFILDQLTKHLIITWFSLYETRTVIPGFFNLTYITNTGAAFGILKGPEPWRHVFFQAISVAAILSLVYVYLSSAHVNRSFFWGLSLVFGGAMGNLSDRIRYGHVVDFLDFYSGDWHWPAFNVADSAITIGAILLAYHFLFVHDQSV